MKKLSHITLAILLVMMVALTAVVPSAIHAQEDESTFFITEDKSFSVVLPAGWFADGDREEGLSVANSEEALAAMGSEDDQSAPEEGQLGIQVIALPISSLGDTEQTLLEVLDTLIGILSADEPVFEVTESQEIDMAGHPAAYAVATTSEVESAAVVYVIAPGTYGVAFMATQPGGLDALLEDAFNVLATVRHSLAIEESFDNGTFAFNYTTDWFTEDVEVAVIVHDSEETSTAEDLADGQYRITIFSLDSLGIDTSVSMEEAATSFVALALEDDETASEPFTLEIAEIEFVIVDVLNGDEEYIGGVFVTSIPALDIYVGAAFGASPNNAYQVSLTALSMLFTLEVTVVTE